MSNSIGLTQAILVFDAAGETYMELAHYAPTKKQGEYEEISRGPLSAEDLKGLVQASFDEQERYRLKGRINRTVLRMDVGNMGFLVSWTPKKTSTAIVAGTEHPCKWPEMMMETDGNMLKIYVKHRGKFYENPFPNAVGRAQMCFGDIRRKSSIETFEELFTENERYFFSTSFTGSNGFLDSCIAGNPDYSLIKTQEYASGTP